MPAATESMVVGTAMKIDLRSTKSVSNIWFNCEAPRCHGAGYCQPASSAATLVSRVSIRSNAS